MNILIKYIVQSMRERKLRTFLIIFAVMLSAALFFAANGITKSMVTMQEKQILQQVGCADLAIYPDKESPSNILNSRLAKNKLSNQVAYVIDTLQIPVKYRKDAKTKENMTLYGITLEDYKKLNTINLVNQLSGKRFEGTQIIISKKTADQYNLKVGDGLDFMLDGVQRKLNIFGIATCQGIFLNESDSFYAITPYDTVSKYADTKGKPNKLYIKATDPTDIITLKSELERLYPKYKVRQVFDPKDYAYQTNMLAVSFNMMAAFITFMSIFIVYTVFKVITLEKLPVIGTFRSVGADKGMINKVLLMESLIYGIVGGILACVVGVAILYVMTLVTMPSALRGIEKVQLDIQPSDLIATFILANVVTFVSSILPILKVSKIPIKEVVLNNLTHKYKKPTKGFKSGVVLVIISFVILIISPTEYKGIVSILAMFLCLGGMIRAIPGCVFYASHLFQKLFSLCFGNIGAIASKNIRENKSNTNSITLISIGIACMLMITTISGSLNIELFEFFKTTLKYDVYIGMPNMDNRDIKKLRTNSKIQDIYTLCTYGDIPIEGINESIPYIDGINRKYSEYYNVRYTQNKEILFKELFEGRNILLGKNFASRIGIKEGETILLNFGEVKKSYKVIGFVDSLLDNGNFGLVSEKYLEMDTCGKSRLSARIKTSYNPYEVAEEIEEMFASRSVYTETRLASEIRNRESNTQLMGMLQAFSILALIIGIIGVINNLIISFIERKRALAVYKSVGMSKKQVIQMIFLEAFATGLLGGILGVVMGVIFLFIFPDLMTYMMGLTLPMHHSISTMMQYIIGGITITLIASVVPASRSSKLNIIEEIRFE